jgi:serine phosphatase RsbU (regulator of sigma subunit)
MMSVLLRHFSRQSSAALLGKAYLTTLLIAVIDYMTGADLSLLIFYFFPIIVISWFLGKWHGIGIALAAALATTFHDLLLSNYSAVLGPENVSHYWRFLQRGGVFLIVSMLVAALRASEDEKRNIEHRLARKVQSFLLPHTSSSMGSLNCFGFCRPSEYLTGDFFDIIFLGPTKLAIMVGDICGKGMSAALLMAYVQGVLRSHVPFAEESLAELISKVNRSLHLSTADDKFATLFIGVYDDENQTLTYVNAGHDPPVIFRWNPAEDLTTTPTLPWDERSNSQELPTGAPSEIMKLQAGGLLLGVDPDAEYTTIVQRLQHGDIIVCDTDGVKEAKNEHGEMYGSERLTQIVASNQGKSSTQLHNLVISDIERFVGKEPQFDDMTLVIGKVVCKR